MNATRSQDLQLTTPELPSWAVNLGLAAAVGLAYFLAVQLAFGLLTANKVAVFWPASGVAIGAIIILGPRARWAVVVGVMTAVLAAHLMTAKPFLAGLVSAIADGAEVAVVGGLIRYLCDSTFTLSRVRHVLALIAASVAGVCVSAIGGLAATHLQVTPPLEPALTSFIDWVASNTIGALVVAPFIIGVDASIRNPPQRREVVEGITGLVVVAALTAGVILLPDRVWAVFLPIVWLIPAFTLMAGRCQPACVAAGVFIVCMTIVWAVTFGIGHFAHAAGSMGHVIAEARVAILVVALSALLLAALFAERRDSEQRLAHSNKLLERERDSKLMNIQAALASISHEIQQPLTAILMNGAAAQQLLKLDLPDLEGVRTALAETQHATLSISEVLDNLRMLYGKGEREKQSIEVNELARAALQLLRKNLLDNNVNATLELASDLPPILGHRGQLQEVLLNLAQNAIESMAAVERDARTLIVRTRHDSSAIIVEVQDSGPGIDPAHLEHIFEAFVTTKSTGMGLGLAICKAIVESHGGRLVASSHPGRGALFQVFIPIGPRA